jgi:hypothetical protein
MRSSFRLVPLCGALLVAAPFLSAQQRVASAAALGAPLAPRVMPAGHYEFTRTDDDGDVTTGAVSWTDQQMRIDIDRSRTRAQRRVSSATGAATAAVSSRRGEYTLVDFASNTVRTVKPESREISEMPLATFEQIIGKALGMVGGVVQMQVRDAGIIAKEVGPGSTVAGLTTQQFRMIEEYNVRVGVFGMNADEKHHRVVTDYWVPTQSGIPRNPMFELLMRSASATAQQDVAHQANLSRARTALFAGYPVRATVTVTETGEAPKRSSIEITSLSAQSPDAALFALPVGYRVKKNDLNFSL